MEGHSKVREDYFSELKKYYEVMGFYVIYLFLFITVFETLGPRLPHLGLVQRFSTRDNFDPQETFTNAWRHF